MDIPKYLTAGDLAEILRVHKDNVNRWVREHTLKPSLRLPNGEPRFIFEDILKQLKDKEKR